MKLRILIFLDLVSWHCLQDQLPAYVSPNLEGFHVPTLPSYGHDLQEEFHISDLWGHGVDNQRNDAGHIEEDPNTCCVRVRFSFGNSPSTSCFVLFFGPGHGHSRTKGNFQKCISCFKSYAKIVHHFDPF